MVGMEHGRWKQRDGDGDGRRDKPEVRTLFVIVPLMLAMRMMLPPFPNRAIWRPAACAVYNTPFVFTFITYSQQTKNEVRFMPRDR